MSNLKHATLLIRADSNAAIGTGHVMRCLALAQAWRTCEGRVVFLSQCDGSNIEDRILEEGCEFVPLTTNDEDCEHLNETLQACRNFKPAWLVIDGYHLTSNFQLNIRQAGIQLLVLDDCCHMPCYHADVLLNQNITATDYSYSVDPDTVLLLGPQYALLRKEFFSCRKQPVQSFDSVNHVLFSMGGSDPRNATQRMMRILNASSLTRQLETKIIVGAANKNIDQIRNFAVQCGSDFRVCESTSRMPQLMEWADFAITAGGSTCLELAYIGTPMAALVIADNQHHGVKKLAENNICLDLGAYENWDETRIIRTIETGIQSASRRMELQAAGWALVDGLGAMRVVEQMRSHV